jgi:hypothetical protein
MKDDINKLLEPLRKARLALEESGMMSPSAKRIFDNIEDKYIKKHSLLEGDDLQKVDQPDHLITK